MTWGYDDWLMDREARQDWMRSVALNHLAQQILRTPALVGEGLACILDEVLGGRDVLDASEIPKRVADDLIEAEAWVRAAVAEARAKGVQFQSAAILLPDGPTYGFRLALVDASVRAEEEWADSITWESAEDLGCSVLERLVPLLSGLPAPAQSHANYVVPLAYAAFLLRDVFRAANAEQWHPLREAIAIYDGGDSLAVPMPRA